jgi:hypothetical protein
MPPRDDTTDDGEEPVPTFPPSDGGAGDAQTDGDDGGTFTGVIIGLALAILAVAAALALATVVLARRFRP